MRFIRLQHSSGTPAFLGENHTVQRSIIAPAERVTNLRWGIALILGFGVLVNYIDRGALSVAATPLHDELAQRPINLKTEDNTP